jgi:hypothetical protein
MKLGVNTGGGCLETFTYVVIKTQNPEFHPSI